MLNTLSLYLIFDKECIIQTVGKGLIELLGYSKEELIGKRIQDILWKKKFPFDPEIMKERAKKAPVQIESLVFLKKDGSPLYFTGKLRKLPLKDRESYLLSGWDVTSLVIYKRFYRILFAINNILLNVHTEEELYQKICESLVEDFGMRMAWVGIPDYEKGVIKPYCFAGYEEGYLEKLRIVLCARSA